MTPTPTPSPEAEALPTLPVVAWLRENKKTHDVRAVRERNPNAEWAHDFTALTPRAPAEAAIVALRAEVERLRNVLTRVVDCDWAYLGKDADTGNPDSLYSRIREGRNALSARASLLGDGGTL